MSDAVKEHNNIIYYERERKKMENTSDQRSSEQSTSDTESASTQSTAANPGGNAPGSTGSGSEDQKGSISKKTAETIAIIGGLLGLITFAFNVSLHISDKFASQEKDVALLQKDIEVMREEFSGIKGDNDDIADQISTLDGKIDELSSIVKDNHEIFLQLASKDTGEKIYNVVFKDAFQVKVETIQSEEYLAAPLWNEDEKAIANDAESESIIYGAEDLCNTPIITSYMEDGNEVYFYGRFNEDNCWNGKCILNVYNGNKLVSIFEGLYDNGELYSYKRVVDKGDIWLVNDRVYQGEYNSGETWKYAKTDDFVKGFSAEDVKEKQILTVDKFLQSKGQELLSYYYGRTSNGLYNDKTGTAYLISYFESGELPGVEGEAIRTLYQGNFKDGEYDDSTGNAWYITREANTKYMYYAGSFSNGDADHETEKEPPKNPVDYDYIVQKLIEKGLEKYSLQFWVDY